MKSITRSLTGALLVAAAVLGTGRRQCAAQEVTLSEIRAQQPPETIHGSALCQRAREAPRGQIQLLHETHPNTFVQDLDTLMEKSDDVILALRRDAYFAISPNGESLTVYEEARVIRSWKGSHHAGDILTFGTPGGWVDCATQWSPFSVMLDSPGRYFVGEHGAGPIVWVLFLRQSSGEETQLVQGLRLAAGDGVQGMFEFQTHDLKEFQSFCAAVVINGSSVQKCDAYLETLPSPMLLPYSPDFYTKNPVDPLAKRYSRMPASDFLREVQSIAAAR
jgi:hypothetical protein